MNSTSSVSTFRGFPRLPSGTHGLLIDRCLANGLARTFARFNGVQAVDLREVYTDDQFTPDTQFLLDAGRHGWGVLTQNDAMLREPDEMAAIREAHTRLFTLTSSQLTAAGKGVLFGRHLLSINRRMRVGPGPCFWRLYEHRIQKDIR